jgi:hypothetical protein
VAVALNVVAGHDRERKDAAFAPPLERLGNEAEHRRRRGARGEVGPNHGVGRVEFAADLFVKTSASRKAHFIALLHGRRLNVE